MSESRTLPGVEAGARSRRQADGPGATVFALASGASLVALAVLGYLVSAGSLTRVDDYALQHFMPYATPSGGGSDGLLTTLFDYDGGGVQGAYIPRFFASPGVASILVGVLVLVLWRREQRLRAALWVVAFLTVSLVEVVCKLTIARPPVYFIVNGSPATGGFLHSFPSGHAARALIVAAAAASVWPRLWPLLLAYASAVIASSELVGVHTPTDLAGGILLATALISAVLATERGLGRNTLAPGTGGTSQPSPKRGSAIFDVVRSTQRDRLTGGRPERRPVSLHEDP